jgi:hypothetical protein
MQCRVLLLGCAVVALTLAGGEVATSDTIDHKTPLVASQQPPAASHGLSSRSGESTTLEVAPQGAESKTGELAPQPGMSAANPRSSNTSEQRQFKPSDAVDVDKRDFRPQEDEPFSPPCLGAALEYTTKCYRGMEEHGLEVVSVDPSSGAARAGLHGQARATALGIAGGIGGLLLGPLELMVLPLLERSGALGTGGDLVLAVDDIRVRDVNEFRKAMRALKPGDSVYLTVIRPLRGRGHQTMRIRVDLDSCSNADVVQGPMWRKDQIPPHSGSLN